MTTVPVRRHNHVRRLASDRAFDGALYPMYFIIIASISDPSLVAQGKILLLPRGVTLEGYEHLASMKNLWVGYGNTILYTIAGTAIMLVVNIPVAYALSRRDLVGRRWFTLFFVFPMFFGGGLIPTFIIINNWFHLLDTFTVMVLPFSVIAYYIIVARTFFQSSLPAELWDAAQIDGCGNLRYFFTIVLPLVQPALITLTIFTFNGAWNNFLWPLIINTRSSMNVLTITMATLSSNQTTNYGMVMAGATLTFVFPFLLYVFLQKQFVEGVAMGGVKG